MKALSRLPQLLVLACLIVAAHARADEAPPANRLHQSLDWWVGRDGTVTKRYDVSYEGEELLSRLDEFAKGFASRLAYVENFIPFLEDTDELVEKKELSRGKYRFLYRSSKKQDTRPDAKPSLIVWVPVMDDPTGVPWRSEGTSQYRYRFLDMEVSSRVAIRGPWKFPAGLSHHDIAFSEPGIDARLTAREVRTQDKASDRPGWDLDGMETRAVIRTEPYELRGEDFDRLRKRLQEWSKRRIAGAALVGFPGDKAAAGAEFGGGSEYAAKFLQLGDLSFGGFDLGLQFYYRRQYSRYFAWRMASLRTDFLWGSEPEKARVRDDDSFFSFGASLSSLAEIRLPTFASSSGAKRLSYYEIYAGPGIHFTTLARDTVEETLTAFTPGVTGGFRWGFSNPNSAFLGSGALGFRYTAHVGGARRFESSWMIALETLL